MPLNLPTNPAPSQVTARPVSARNDLRPAFGGSTQRLLRKGTKYALDVVMPPMPYTTAMDWIDLDDETETVVLKVPQPGLDIGSPGAPQVNGANQTGSTLAIKGLTPGYVIRKGQFLSIMTGGQRFLYRAKAAATANGSALATVTLQTLLRYPPANNDTVEIAEPRIEGFVQANAELWTVDVARLVGLQFTIEERE